jgi:hypothetical protein
MWQLCNGFFLNIWHIVRLTDKAHGHKMYIIFFSKTFVRNTFHSYKYLVSWNYAAYVQRNACRPSCRAPVIVVWFERKFKCFDTFLTPYIPKKLLMRGRWLGETSIEILTVEWGFRSFHQSLLANTAVMSLIRTQSFPSTSFPVPYPL